MLRPLKIIKPTASIFDTKFDLVRLGSKTNVGHFNNEVRNVKDYPFIRIFHRWSKYGDIDIDGNEWDEGTYDYVVTPNSKIILGCHPYNYDNVHYRVAFKIDTNYNITCMSMLNNNGDDSIILFGFVEKKLRSLINKIKIVFNLIDCKNNVNKEGGLYA